MILTCVTVLYSTRFSISRVSLSVIKNDPKNRNKENR